ncbi:SGM_5486 family transporter-associated protein [Streptomyces sp. GTA36]
MPVLDPNPQNGQKKMLLVFGAFLLMLRDHRRHRVDRLALTRRKPALTHRKPASGPPA